MTPNTLRNCFAAALAACLALSTRADELGDKGREIFEKNQHAIVTVEVVLKISYSSEGRTSPPTKPAARSPARSSIPPASPSSRFPPPTRPTCINAWPPVGFRAIKSMPKSAT